MSENERDTGPQPPFGLEGQGEGEPRGAEQPGGGEEEPLLTPEEEATLSPAEKRALARKRLAERIRATIPDEQRRMTKKAGTPTRTGQPPTTGTVETPAPPAPEIETERAPAVTPPQPTPTPEPWEQAPPPPAGMRSTEEAPPVSPTPPDSAVPPQAPTPPSGRLHGTPRGRRPVPPQPRGGRMVQRRGAPAPAVVPIRPTNLPTRAREPQKVHPIGVALLVVLALAVSYFFADIWGLFFVPLLLVFLWRKVDSRELIGITAVMVAAVPLIMVVQGIDLGGHIDSSYALKQMLAHAVAGIAVGLLAVACVVAAVDWRYRVLPLDPAGDPNDEPVLVTFLPSKKGIGAGVVAKARPLKQEGTRA